MRKYKHIVMKEPESLGQKIKKIPVQYISVRHDKYVKMMADPYQPERSKREDPEKGCGALNSMET